MNLWPIRARILTNQKPPSITPEQERAWMARFRLGMPWQLDDRVVEFIKRRPFATSGIIFLLFALLVSVPSILPIEPNSGSAPSAAHKWAQAPAKNADGSVRVNHGNMGCPQEWQIVDVFRLSRAGDQKASNKAFFEYGCKVFEQPTDWWVEQRDTGFVCARPRGEPRCYWMPSVAILGED